MPDLEMSGIVTSLVCYEHTGMFHTTEPKRDPPICYSDGTYVHMNLYKSSLHAAFLTNPNHCYDYHEKVILSLTWACQLAAESIRRTQRLNKDLYDRITK